MIRSAGPLETPDGPRDAGDLPVDAQPLTSPSPYGPHFWLAYLANIFVMLAIAMLFRYADFIILLGGSEWHLGWIVGTGMVGSIAVRLALGQAIDTYGPRMVWLGSVVLFALVCFAHLFVTTHQGPAIYLLRIAFCCAIAGIFGASMTFVASRVSIVRLAEMWGMLGTAGFVGMMLGPQISDWLVGSGPVTRLQLDRMFLVAGLFGCGSVVFAYLATRGERARPRPHRRPLPLLGLVRRYQPGSVLLVGIVMGVAIGLPNTFLRTFAAEMAIPRIGVFFGFYAPAAILTRVLGRRLPERLGPEPLILLGLAGMMLSQLLFLLVRVEWQLLVPGIGYGISHAILFPSVIAAGSSAFPDEHRGVGNLLILAMFDLGILVGAPMVGIGLEAARFAGLVPYPAVFLALATVMGTTAIGYRLTWRRGNRPWEHVRQFREGGARADLSGEPAIEVATGE